MPKKSKKSVNDLKQSFYDWAECKWEFQRRSEAYRLWWSKNRPKQNLKYPDPDLNFDQLIDLLKENSKAFANQIANGEYISEEEQNKTRSEAFSIGIFQFLFPEAIEMDIKKDNMSTLELKIDFNKINSITHLVDLVGLLIRDHHRLLTQLELPKKSKSQTYWKEWKRILAVGDMKRAGLTGEEIAGELARKRLIEPRRWRDKPESVLRAVYDDLKKYKYLVDKGYNEIRYP
jgi:hypothetical protein